MTGGFVSKSLPQPGHQHEATKSPIKVTHFLSPLQFQYQDQSGEDNFEGTDEDYINKKLGILPGITNSSFEDNILPVPVSSVSLPNTAQITQPVRFIVTPEQAAQVQARARALALG